MFKENFSKVKDKEEDLEDWLKKLFVALRDLCFVYVLGVYS